MQTTNISLVLSTYNWPEALQVTLESVSMQTVLPDEILIADDGSDMATKAVIEAFQQKITIPIVHFWQEDNGFRKTLIMNKAIVAAKYPYVIQIDGDIVIHPKFIADHRDEAAPGYYIKGSRSMLSPDRTKKILETKDPKINALSSGVGSKINATRFPALSSFFRGDRFRSNNLRGCNFSFWKQDFIEVNGYNNDLKGWGHEDIELAARLSNLGIKQRQLKMKAVCFHLYHKINSRHNEDINYQKYLKTVKDGIIRCADGIIKL